LRVAKGETCGDEAPTHVLDVIEAACLRDNFENGVS
jgi:hypothetical protein